MLPPGYHILPLSHIQSASCIFWTTAHAALQGGVTNAQFAQLHVQKLKYSWLFKVAVIGMEERALQPSHP